jgi:hypothetical protein
VQDFARRHPFKKLRSGRAIRNVTARKQKGDWTTFGIGQGVDFSRAAATGAADGVIFLPPLPPDAERCAFTAEESISTCAGGPPACASAWNKSTQTPLAAQRT